MKTNTKLFNEKVERIMREVKVTSYRAMELAKMELSLNSIDCSRQLNNLIISKRK